eukprot:Skav235906  [mRNA]  locus=scaffold256:299189:305925:- [translate_table: standard]
MDQAGIRAEISEIRALIQALVVGPELSPAGASASSGGGGVASTSGYRSPLSQEERDSAARETGRFFRRCLNGEPRGSSGRDVDGVRGYVRGNIPRAASLCWVTAKVIELGLCSVGLLEAIAGGFVSLFTFRRRLMSLLDLVYDAQGGREQGDVVALSPALRDELWGLWLTAPLAVADLRVPHCEEIFMVDASNWGEAVCASTLEGSMRGEVHRHGLVKSCWTKLLTPYKAMLRAKGCLPVEEELPEGEVPYSTHPVWEAAARSLLFKTVWKQRAKRNRHINVGEVRSFLRAEALAGRKHGSVRVAVGSDSQVCAGVICKGRSASHALNRELKRSIPTVVGGGIFSCTGYVNTKHNPADDPTWGVQVRSPDVEKPQWWLQAQTGDFSLLDNLLKDFELEEHQVGGYRQLSELYPHDMSQSDIHCKPKGTRMHRKVSQKLKLRAVNKLLENPGPLTVDEFSSGLNNISPWNDDIYNELLSFGKEAFIFGDGYAWPPTCPGFLDLFSGRKGYAKAACRYGAPWVLTIDYNDGPQFDLLNPKLRSMIFRLLQAGFFLHVSAAPICASFSKAITPAVRSPSEPLGITPIRPSMMQKISEGNSHAAWLGFIISWCINNNVGYWVANPDGSYIWLHPALKNLPKGAAQRYARIDSCSFGTPWRKRTRFLASGRLVGLRRLCDRQHKHRLLRGRAKGARACWTKLAEPYPRQLCSFLAWAVCSDLKLYKQKPKSSKVYRGDQIRVGEAKNPGPRPGRIFRRNAALLEEVELIRPQTMAIGSRQWELFLEWAASTLGSEVIPSLWLSPGLMGQMMGLYGKHMFECGKALFNYRHLVVFAQREFSGLKGFLQPAWETINRWEELEPVEHRRPLPAALVRALVGVAILWGWFRVAAVILISFHGCCRPGEVLKGCRGQLVFPADVGQVDGPIFYRIQKPKPGRRGMGRVQHTKILPVDVCVFLTAKLFDLQGDAFIYPGSASSFRTRWDRLLRALEVPLVANLTPGGLRAGGTVELYRRGTPIADILWTLRLKNIETLQHYLQEISTQITMVDLPSRCKLLVHCFGLCFSHLVSIH